MLCGLTFIESDAYGFHFFGRNLALHSDFEARVTSCGLPTCSFSPPEGGTFRPPSLLPKAAELITVCKALRGCRRSEHVAEPAADRIIF